MVAINAAIEFEVLRKASGIDAGVTIEALGRQQGHGFRRRGGIVRKVVWIRWSRDVIDGACTVDGGRRVRRLSSA